MDGLRSLLENELKTDRAFEDVTGALLGDEGRTLCRAWIFAKEPGVFCGERVVSALASLLPTELSEVDCRVADGTRVEAGTRLVEWRAQAATTLAIERTVLNTLSHLCGIATLTRQYVDAVGAFRTRILPTRKTLPGLRDLQLYGVQCGGATIHRRSLSDGVLIKENHQMLVPGAELVARAKRLRSPLHRIELEVQDPRELDRVLEDPPEIVMLDNMDLPTLAAAVTKLRGKCAIEVSGGISLEQVPGIAELGVDYISVGKLTHSVRGLDLSLDVSKE